MEKDLFSPENLVSGNQGGELVKFTAPGQRFIGTLIGSHETMFERGPAKHYDFVHCTVFGVTKDPYEVFTIRGCAMINKGLSNAQPGQIAGIEYCGDTAPVIGQSGMVTKNGTHLFNVWTSPAHIDLDWQKYVEGTPTTSSNHVAQAQATQAQVAQPVAAGGIPVENFFPDAKVTSEPFPTDTRSVYKDIMSIATGKMGATNENEAAMKIGQLTGLALIESNYKVILDKLRTTFGA